MEKQEMNEGMSLKEALEAIRKGLEEDKAFLRLSMLDPDPDARQAEEGRIQNVLALAGVMEEILSRFAVGDEIVVETAKEENRRFDENLEKKETEIREACEEAENIYREEEDGDMSGTDDRELSLRYETHTLGCPGDGDNIEYDWTVESGKECFTEGKGKTKKKSKKNKKNKKDKKSKKDKKKDKK